MNKLRSCRTIPIRDAYHYRNLHNLRFNVFELQSTFKSSGPLQAGAAPYPINFDRFQYGTYKRSVREEQGLRKGKEESLKAHYA